MARSDKVQYSVLFDIPAKISHGLDIGTLERYGGVVREANTKKVVLWLKESGSIESIGQPLQALSPALQQTTALLSGINTCVSVAGFALVLNELNELGRRIEKIEAALPEIQESLDDSFIAKLQAGINACKNAMELVDDSMRTQAASQAINLLHEARHIFSRKMQRAIAKQLPTAIDSAYFYLTCIAAESQVYLQCDETSKAIRVIEDGLNDCRSGIKELLSKAVELSPYLLRHEFAGCIDLNLVLWLHKSLSRIDHPRGETPVDISPNDLFETLRPSLGEAFKDNEEWHGEISQSLVDTSQVPDWYLGPLNQGVDKTKRSELIAKDLPTGIAKVIALIESFEGLSSRCIQLEDMHWKCVSPSEMNGILQLAEGKGEAICIELESHPAAVKE